MREDSERAATAPSMAVAGTPSCWAAIADQDDWTPFDAKIAAIRRMGDAMTQDAPA